MEPGSSRCPAQAGIAKLACVEVIVADPTWRRTVRNAAALAGRAARAATAARIGGPAATSTVVLSSDATVKRLNARHRGRNKPTNVLTFEAMAAGHGGDIFLARETVRREAEAAGRRADHHLAHLIVHGVLHLQGHDHQRAGDARRMELAEARILGRLRLSNPWKPT
jgi:probable rRNA maturation factor